MLTGAKSATLALKLPLNDAEKNKTNFLRLGQESRFENVQIWCRAKSRILKSIQISAVKSQDFPPNLPDFKQQLRNVQQKFLMSTGSKGLKFWTI